MIPKGFMVHMPYRDFNRMMYGSSLMVHLACKEDRPTHTPGRIKEVDPLQAP